jgi:hypothetical protein
MVYGGIGRRAVDPVWEWVFIPRGGVVCAKVDPDMWTSPHSAQQALAARGCQGTSESGQCPVLLECRLEGALNVRAEGVWGGLMPGALRRLRRDPAAMAQLQVTVSRTVHHKAFEGVA